MEIDSSKLKEVDLFREKIKNNNVLYNTLVQTITDAVFILKNQIIVDCNEKASEILNYSEQEILGSPFYHFVEEVGPSVDPSKKIEISGSKKIPFCLLPKNMDPFFADVSFQKLYLEQEDYLLCYARVIDFSEHNLTFEAVAEAEKRLRKSLNNATILAISLSKEGLINYCNQAFLYSTGWEKEDLIGRNIFEILIPSDQVDENKFRLKKFVETGVLSKNMEGQIYSKTGDLLTVRFSSLIISSPLSASGVTIVGENITEERRVKNALNKTTAQLKDLFDYANDLIVIFSDEGKFYFANNTFKEKNRLF